MRNVAVVTLRQLGYSGHPVGILLAAAGEYLRAGATAAEPEHNRRAGRGGLSARQALVTDSSATSPYRTPAGARRSRSPRTCQS